MKKLLFYLINKDGSSLVVDSDKNVISTYEKTPIKYSPIGWKDTSLGYERDLTLHGVFRTLNNGYGFIREIGTILRNTMYKENIEREIYLLIQILNTEVTDEDFAQYYKTVFKGLLDFSTANDERYKVSINIGEEGLKKLFYANKDTVYEIPVNDVEAIRVKMDGREFVNTQNYLLPASNMLSGNGVIGMQETIFEGNKLGFATFSVFETANTGGLNPFTSSDFFAETDENCTGIKITGNITVTGQIKITLVIWNEQGDSLVEVLNKLSGEKQTFQIYLDLDTDRKNWKYFMTYFGPPGCTIEETTLKVEFSSRFHITHVFALTPKTLVKRLIQKITSDSRYFNDTDSVILEDNKNFVITSGDALRSLEGAVIKISLSQVIKSLNTVIGCGVGIENEKIIFAPYEHFYTVEGNARPLGITKKNSIVYAKELIGNVFKFGYREQNYNDVNGRDEFNTTSSYTAPQNTVVKTIEFISDIRADSFGIEKARMNLEGKTTTDASSDNDSFFLDVKNDILELDRVISLEHTEIVIFGLTLIFNSISINGTGLTDYEFGTLVGKLKVGDRFELTNTLNNNGRYTVTAILNFDATNYTFLVGEPVITEADINTHIRFSDYILNRPQFAEIEGVLRPLSIFNVNLSPARIARKHIKYINSLLYGFAGQYLTFQTSDKNKKLRTVLLAGIDIVTGDLIKGEEIDENANILIGNERLFIPYFFNFDNIVPIYLPYLMKTSPNTPFSLEIEEEEYKGILTKAAIALATGKEQSYRILCGPNEQIEKLIK